MQYRPYGKNGYDVSVLGLGCMRFPRIYDGQGGAEVDMEKTFELIRYAVEHGVNYFDSAFSYHNQLSESILGEALDGGYRQRVKIATKQPLGVMHTQDDIRRNLENTLKKLRTDYIDVYLIHNIQGSTWEETKNRKIIEEYEKFRSEGLIRSIGFSYHGDFPAFRDIVTFYPWAMCQIQQNLLDVDREATQEAITLAGDRGVALAIMEPLRGGGLVNPPPAVQQLYDSYDPNRSAAEWAFRHLIDYPQVSTILSGMTTLEQLKENIEIFSKPDVLPGCLNAEEKRILREVKGIYERLIAVPCTACEYCMPCPAGVSIPGVFSLYNEGTMFDNFSQPQRSYMFTCRAGRDASKCVECGACEAACPQHIQIIEELKRAHAALEGWIE